MNKEFVFELYSFFSFSKYEHKSTTYRFYLSVDTAVVVFASFVVS